MTDASIQPCPRCNSRDVLPIRYGMMMPSFPLSEEEERAGLARPTYISGGCVIDADSPDFMCGACHHEWQSSGPRSIGGAGALLHPDAEAVFADVDRNHDDA
jgi:hypothetical protein